MTDAAGYTTADVHRAVLEATAGPIAYAKQLLDGRPLPHINSPEFIEADVAVRRAVLLILGTAWALEDPRTPGLELDDTWPSAADYIEQGWHRVNVFTEHSEVQKARYGPTGNRADWIANGTPRPTVEVDPELQAAFDAVQQQQLPDQQEREAAA